MDNFLCKFNESLQTGFIDQSILSDENYRPELLLNQKKPPQKVLNSIISELENCDEFCFSIAFATTSGVSTLTNTLLTLQEKNIKGKILVSQYLNFTQPEALRKLSKFKNVELKIATIGNSHSKGYIFKKASHHDIIIGSSNLTGQALTTNKEWNLKVSALNDSEIVSKVQAQFDDDFKAAKAVTQDFISSYEEIYKLQFVSNKSFNENIGDKEIVPNSMQKEALANLHQLRLEEKEKALLISATGTGKTYLSAFDAKEFNPKKLLFVVHRLTIAEDAMKTFKAVFKKSRKMGIFSSKRKELEADFIFSTVQTISKLEHLESFKKDHFDYIIIDETHRSGAESYLKLIDYFNPEFLLGMTATPERTDGQDIYSLFDHNIAYEIRLNRAMEEEMLAPFHYYGVSDFQINKEITEDKSKFNTLVAEERVERIIEHSEFYGTDNGITRGLIFCSGKEEAKELSSKFNMKGFRTIALTGDSSDELRTESIEKLESDKIEEKLDYIFTVDIFNEGIDIPKVNQIIMLRPTQSAIIFIQQLGRGLRKLDSKSYLTVIDFIGNYDNNYLIPIALYGDTSYNKDTLRKLLSEGSLLVPGQSTINFDRISKEQIFKSIDSANMSLLSDLRKDYKLLKFRLGRIPLMIDFIEHSSRHPFLFVNYSGSYYNFVTKVDKEAESELSPIQTKLLELFSKEINNSKRVEESIILKKLLEIGTCSIQELREIVLDKYHYMISNETIDSCHFNLNFEFIRDKKDKQLVSVRDIYDFNLVNFKNGVFSLLPDFSEYLKTTEFKLYLSDSIDFSIREFDKLYDPKKWQNGFVLYRKYSRKDVFRILNRKQNPVAQNVGGYLINESKTDCPIFVNYHKEEDISETTKYVDQFVNKVEFDWMSKSGRKLTSPDVVAISGQNGPIRLPLFIKKQNDEGMELYYMGEVQSKNEYIQEGSMEKADGKSISVVKFRFQMSTPVEESMYKYIREKSAPEQKKPQESQDKQKENQTTLRIVNPIPLYNFYAAAGSFSEMQFEKDFQLIKGPSNLKNSSDYFACKIIGESMNKTIPNGSICLFKMYNGGSRNGKIVLVENMDYSDQDFNSAFTIKTYTSQKTITEEGWQHTAIILKPNSSDSTYQDIVITEEDSNSIRVVGEFVSILD